MVVQPHGVNLAAVVRDQKCVVRAAPNTAEFDKLPLGPEVDSARHERTLLNSAAVFQNPSSELPLFRDTPSVNETFAVHSNDVVGADGNRHDRAVLQTGKVETRELFLLLDVRQETENAGGVLKERKQQNEKLLFLVAKDQKRHATLRTTHAESTSAVQMTFRSQCESDGISCHDSHDFPSVFQSLHGLITHCFFVRIFRGIAA